MLKMQSLSRHIGAGALQKYNTTLDTYTERKKTLQIFLIEHIYVKDKTYRCEPCRSTIHS